MASEFKVRVADATTRDIGRGKARINKEIMKKIGVTAGDVIQIKGRRSTVAVAWPFNWGDRRKNIIRIDDLTRKNAECSLNDEVIISKPKVSEAKNFVLSPNMRLNVDHDFINFVKTRIIEKPVVQGDSIFVNILGSAIPFVVLRVRPKGVVKISSTTDLQILSEPTGTGRDGDILTSMKLTRFAWLREVEKRLGVDYTRFVLPKVIEDEMEEPVIKEAKKKADETGLSVKVYVDLWEKRGKIGSLDWALVRPNDIVEYIFDRKKEGYRTRQQIQSVFSRERGTVFSEKIEVFDLVMTVLKDHERMLDNTLRKLSNITSKLAKIENNNEEKDSL